MHTAHTRSGEAKGAVRTSMAALLLSVKVAHMKGEDGHLAQRRAACSGLALSSNLDDHVCIYLSVRRPAFALIIVSGVLFVCTPSLPATWVPVSIINIIVLASSHSCILFLQGSFFFCVDFKEPTILRKHCGLRTLALHCSCD